MIVTIFISSGGCCCCCDAQRAAHRKCYCREYIATGPVNSSKKGKGSPYWITERRVPELIPVFGSQPAGDVSHKPGGRLPLLSARPTVTLATLLPVSLLGEQRHDGCEQFA